MIRIETLLLRGDLWTTGESREEWRDPTRMVPLDRAMLPRGRATIVLPGAVLLDMGGTTVFDHTYDTDVLGWWSQFVAVLEQLTAGPEMTCDFSVPDQGMWLTMQRRRDRVTCSLDYKNSRTGHRVALSATDSFDELLRKSLDAAEAFYVRIIDLDPDNAGVNLGYLSREVLEVRRRLIVEPWPEEQTA